MRTGTSGRPSRTLELEPRMNTVKLDLTMTEAVHVHIALDLVTRLLDAKPDLATSPENLPTIRRYKHVIETALKAKGATYNDGVWMWDKRA